MWAVPLASFSWAEHPGRLLEHVIMQRRVTTEGGTAV